MVQPFGVGSAEQVKDGQQIKVLHVTWLFFYNILFIIKKIVICCYLTATTAKFSPFLFIFSVQTITGCYKPEVEGGPGRVQIMCEATD
jgi:hypothetical protein